MSFSTYLRISVSPEHESSVINPVSSKVPEPLQAREFFTLPSQATHTVGAAEQNGANIDDITLLNLTDADEPPQ